MCSITRREQLHGATVKFFESSKYSTVRLNLMIDRLEFQVWTEQRIVKLKGCPYSIG